MNKSENNIENLENFKDNENNDKINNEIEKLENEDKNEEENNLLDKIDDKEMENSDIKKKNIENEENNLKNNSEDNENNKREENIENNNNKWILKNNSKFFDNNDIKISENNEILNKEKSDSYNIENNEVIKQKNSKYDSNDLENNKIENLEKSDKNVSKNNNYKTIDNEEEDNFEKIENENFEENIDKKEIKSENKNNSDWKNEDFISINDEISNENFSNSKSNDINKKIGNKNLENKNMVSKNDNKIDLENLSNKQSSLKDNKNNNSALIFKSKSLKNEKNNSVNLNDNNSLDSDFIVLDKIENNKSNMFYERGNNEKIFLEKKIKFNKIIFKKNKSFINKFIIYEIHFSYGKNKENINKRFSDFLFLKNYLQLFYPYEIIPILPKKKLFNKLIYNPNLYEKRSFELKLFWDKLIENKYFLHEVEIIKDFLFDNDEKMKFYKNKYNFHYKYKNILDNFKFKVKNYFKPKVIKTSYSEKMLDVFDKVDILETNFKKLYESFTKYLSNILLIQEKYKEIYTEDLSKLKEEVLKNDIEVKKINEYIFNLKKFNFLIKCLSKTFKNYEYFLDKRNSYNNNININENNLNDIEKFINDIEKEIPSKVENELLKIEDMMNNYFKNFKLNNFLNSQKKLFKFWLN